MGKQQISRFESLAQRLVEGSFSRLFGGRIQPLDVANQLARAMEDSQQENQAADLYYVYLHPQDYRELWQQNPKLTQELTDYLSNLAQQLELLLPARPFIQLQADEEARRQQIRVQAEHSQQPADETQVRSRKIDKAADVALKTVDAFFIIDGRRHVPLDRPFITIGRRTDNDIVLDAPTVSRQHAQLRWRHGRFVLYDLGSRGGTAINGEETVEAVLQPGDVVTLSDVNLIYGEGLAEQEKRRPKSASSHNNAPTVTLAMPANGDNANDQ